MTKQQKDDLFFFLQKFCSDNHGNRLTEWLIESFLNRAHRKLEELVKTDSNDDDQSQEEKNGC
jgi:hypothetical protein